MPGFIDMHVHLRDPGLTWKEDIESGSKAAARGGFTTIVAMPNTKPVMDSPDRIDYVTVKARSCAPIHVLQAGAATKGQKGQELADIEGMAAHGIPAISEDGKSVMNSKLCREAMLAAAKCGIPFLDHCEDADLAAGGCVNEDENSRKSGLPGISNAAEDAIAARDALLAAETGVHLHLCHCSTRNSAVLLKLAKLAGVSISGEVCPHHFTLCSDDMVPGDTNYKMNPPLRTREDVEALRQALHDDVFESDQHRPCPAYYGREIHNHAQGAFRHRRAGDGGGSHLHRTGGDRNPHPHADGGKDERKSGPDSEPYGKRLPGGGKRGGCGNPGSPGRVCDRREKICLPGQKYSL